MSMPKPHHSALPEDIVVGKAACTAPRLLVPPSEEVPHTIIDVVVDRPVRLQAGAIAEVRGPTAQKAVELVSHVRP